MVSIDFLVPGFSKCGTTTLCALLSQHPELYIPAEKETWYFSSDEFPSGAQEYARYFSRAVEGQLLGEGSVSYSGYRKEDISIERIGENNPDCRFIFIARNPISRIESSYREMHHSGVKFGLNAPYGLSECIDAFPAMVKDSCYFQRISRYVDAFGSGAILVLFLDDLYKQPQLELSRCFRHLGVDDAFQVEENVKLNEGSYKLYDTRLLRYFRNHPWFGPRLAKLDPAAQDRILKPSGLRRRFRKPVQWDERSKAVIREIVLPDTQVFLEAYGKSGDFWNTDFKN